MRSRPILAAAGAAALAAVLAACGGGGDADTVELAETPTAVEVAISSGSVQISVNANVGGATVSTAVDGDVESTIEIVDGVLGIVDTCDGTDCSVDYTITTGSDVSVAVTTDDGNVTVANSEGDVTVGIGDGNLSLASVTGDLQVVMGDGDVIGTRLQAATATFDVEKGNIDITFDEVVTTLVASTGEGDVTVQLPDGEYAFDTTPEEDGVDLLIDSTDGAANTVTLATGGGDITVYRR